MLRRLLELEVPEIYNGTVEIKSIAREAGARSKVAVAATQAGVDPVGSCVGMRGVRIQSIVNELGGEKIDVIEWSSDIALYIAKALSPARVLTVHVDDDPNEGKTALVVVPDDQLSLAIGREGQNARLAAKLTGWRIDINGSTESVRHALKQIDEDSALWDEMGEARAQIPTVQTVLQRHAEQTLPWNSEELQVIRQVIDGAQLALRERRKAERERARAAEKAQRAAARAEAAPGDITRQEQIESYRSRIPPSVFDTPLAALELSTRVMKNLEKSGLARVSEIHDRLAAGDEAMLAIEGIGPKALAEIKLAIESKGLGLLPPPEPVVEAAPPEPEPAVVEAAAPEAVAVEAGAPTEAAVEPPPSAEAAAEITIVPPIVVAAEEEEEEETEAQPGKKKAKKKGRRKDRVLVFDETLGEVVAVKERKRGGELWSDEEI
jgi:N utilization substance protein A